VNDFGQPRIVLAYTHYEVEHVCGLRLLHGVDPLDQSSMASLANDLGALLQDVFDTRVTVTSAYTQNRYGLKLIEIAGFTPFSGTATIAGGSREEASLSITIAGRSTVVGSGGHVGHTLFRLFGVHWLTPGRGQKKFNLTDFTPLYNLATALDSPINCFADFYGNKCKANSRASIQYNAAIQKAYGS